MSSSKDPNEPSLSEALKAHCQDRGPEECPANTLRQKQLAIWHRYVYHSRENIQYKNKGCLNGANHAPFYSGTGGGAGFGAIRFLAKRSVPSAANWAVGSFCLISLISFEMCQMDRRNTVTKLRTKINEVKSRERMQTIEERDKSGALKAVIELPEHLREKKDD